MNKIAEVPIENKLCMTVEEASLYSNIGQGTLHKLLRSPNCPFALYIGKKKLIKRKEFDEFISNSFEL